MVTWWIARRWVEVGRGKLIIKKSPSLLDTRFMACVATMSTAIGPYWTRSEACKILYKWST